jgi:hypothetical protein
LRIIKKNLVHIHGFPKSIAKIDILKTKEYFGQYDSIIKFYISYKINSDNKKVYSAYITYSNETEAACAILCVDSLLIEGKIIRAFFGTTKYCSYFLNNQICQNSDKCMFLHQLQDEKNIIIDDKIIFAYDDHINLAKKIIQYSNPKIRDLFLKKEKPKKIIFPFLDFIFESEEEKEHYFISGNISYVKSESKIQKNGSINDFNNSQSESKYVNNVYNITINLKNNSNLNPIHPKDNNFIKASDKLYKSKFVNIFNDSFDAKEFHKYVGDSIKHIFVAKPFYSNLKNYPYKKLELDFFKKNLEKQGKNFHELFEGCLDCLKDVI